MQLRNGKRTDGTCCRNYPKMAVVPRSNTDKICKAYYSDTLVMNQFTYEIKSMLNDIMKWTSEKERIIGLIDIYDYIQKNYEKVKHIDRLQRFFETVEAKTIDNLLELPKMVKKYHNDDDTIANIKELNILLIEIYVMLKNSIARVDSQ